MESSPLDFVAPVVQSRTNVTEAAIGTIVYDNNSGAFYGVAPGSGTSLNWIQLGASVSGGGSVVSYTGQTDREVRATFACVSGACSVTRPTSSWASISRGSAGSYTVTAASGTFSSTPSCVCSSNGNDSGSGVAACNTSASSATNIAIQLYRAGNIDSNFDIVCVGGQ